MASEEGIGKIEISDEVIGTIAGIAIREIDGIAGMKGGLFEDIRQATTGKKKYSAGVRINRDDDESLSIDIDIIISYDIKVAVTDIAQKAQKAVKEKIEGIAGKTVKLVNVNVVDILLPDDLMDSEKE